MKKVYEAAFVKRLCRIGVTKSRYGRVAGWTAAGAAEDMMEDLGCELEDRPKSSHEKSNTTAAKKGNKRATGKVGRAGGRSFV